jgi:hypothetical protein
MRGVSIALVWFWGDCEVPESATHRCTNSHIVTRLEPPRVLYFQIMSFYSLYRHTQSLHSYTLANAVARAHMMASHMHR